MAAVELAGSLQINVDMFSPVAGIQNPDLAKLVGNVYGREGLFLCEKIKRGENPDLSIRQRVDDRVYESLRMEFGLSSEADMRKFYFDQQSDANDIINNTIDKALRNHRRELELKNEVAFSSDRPSDALAILADPSKVDPVLYFELKRRLLLSLVCAHLDLRGQVHRLGTELSDAQHLLTMGLYDGKIGETRERRILAFHDNETNEFQSLVRENNVFLNSRDSHIKEHEFEVRSIAGQDIYTSPRKKKKASSVLKAIEKAHNNGRVIDALNDVQDGYGIQFVAIDEGVSLEDLSKKVVEALKPRGIVRIDDDHCVDDDHGQSREVRFQRKQILFEGAAIPMELIFFNIRDYLDSQLKVGKRQAGINYLAGQSHSLYELRRIYDILDQLFPEEIYRFDARAAVSNISVQVAQGLLYKNRVTARI